MDGISINKNTGSDVATFPATPVTSAIPATKSVPGQEIDPDILEKNWLLIVDDDTIAVDEISSYLTLKGFTCLTAYDGVQALEEISRTPQISIVLTDIRMPSLDGLEMTKQVHEKAAPERHLEVIIMTGHGGKEEAIEALQAGAMDFITKPVSLKHLLHSIRKAMELIQYRQSEIDHRHALEAALEKEKQLTTMQRDFMSMVSHEYRTPLAIIDGAAQFFIRHTEKLDTNKIVERAESIRSSVRRMIVLLDDTLNASRLDSGEVELFFEEINLQMLLGEIRTRFMNGKKSHALEFDLGDLPQRIDADSHLLDLVFTNLISNAVKYSPNAERVDISGWVENDYAVVTIKDYGIGIPPDEVQHVFDKFFRASTARTIEGTGLGLCFSKKIIDLHGGDISLSSELNVGSTVTVCLPIEGKTPAETTPSFETVGSTSE